MSANATVSQPVREWHLIARGLAGWHAYGINVRSEGGALEDRPWWAGGTQYGYLTRAIDGAYVYDASEADETAFASFVFNGPMPDPSLQPGTVRRFLDTETAASMAPGMSGAFQSLATLAATGTYGGLDYVAVDLYIELMRSRVPGVKFGRVRGGAIEWEP